MEISNLNLKSMKPGGNDAKKSSWETLTLRENRKKLTAPEEGSTGLW